MHREKRILTACPVELERKGRVVRAESEDLSQRGVYVHTEHVLPVRAVVKLKITLPGDQDVRMVARVAHHLNLAEAHALGRRSGMGLEFLEHEGEGRDTLMSYLEPLLRRSPSVPPETHTESRVVVVDPDVGELEQVLAALRDDGFDVRTAYSGAEAYTMSLEEAPDIVVASARMPGMDGWELVRAFMGRASLHLLPVVLIVDAAEDLEKLKSRRIGVTDFVRRPLDGGELCARLRRIAASDRPTSGRIVLHGNLAEIGLRTLLSLLDFERKSGVLDLVREDEQARLFLAGGRIVKIEGPTEHGGPRERVLRVLDWVDGEFELAACEIIGSDEVGVRTSTLLLEHARLADERDRS